MVTVIFMKIETVIGVVFLAMYLAPSVSPSHGQTAGEILKVYEPLKRLERKTRLMEGAKKEGLLVFYGTLGVDAARPMLEKFRQAHPYISIGHYRSGSTGIYNRVVNEARAGKHEVDIDRKSTRLNSSHGYISYAVFCLKKKKQNDA